MVITPAMERRIRKGVIKRSIETLSKFSRLEREDDLFYALPAAAFAAFNLNRESEAANLAGQAIAAAASFEQDWNYGNSLHAGHTVLGLLALKAGDTEKAMEHLQASGDVRGSPQLNSFGPSMQLARELLLAGKSEPVLAFFDQCRQFWKSGSLWLDVWTRKVARGRVPNFFMNLHR
jgi:tetratricopeptide (TPR) repeat protein